MIETQSNGEISEETLIFITGVLDVEHEISKRKKVIETQSNGEISEKTHYGYFHYGCTRAEIFGKRQFPKNMEMKLKQKNAPCRFAMLFIKQT